MMTILEVADPSPYQLAEGHHYLSTNFQVAVKESSSKEMIASLVVEISEARRNSQMQIDMSCIAKVIGH